MTKYLLFPLFLSLAIAYQTPPIGHTPGSNGHKGSNLCDVTNGSFMVGEISLSQDSTLFAGISSSTASMGKFAAGRTPDGLRRALLSFDMSSVLWPADVKVACAEVRLAVDKAASVSSPSTNGNTLHKVTKAWTTNGFTHLDGIHGNTAQEGDATWQYSSYPTEEWHTPGGDFTSDSLSRETIIPAADGVTYAYFGSTKRMHTIVNEWIESPGSNYGMLIKSDELANDPIAFNVYYGMEHDPKLVPTLIVVYTAPSLGYEHQEHPPHHHHSNIPDLNGHHTDGGNDPTSNQPPDSTSGTPDQDGNNLTGDKPDLGGTFDEDGDGHPNEPSDSLPTPTSDNTNGPTMAPQHPKGDDDTHSSTNKQRTFPPINHDTQTHTTGMKKSHSDHSFLAVIATCTVVSFILLVVSCLTLRGAKAPRHMTPDEVIGNDLSLETDRELV